MSAPSTTFTHTPRPARMPASHPSQRYFGADLDTGVLGLHTAAQQPHTASVTVLRHAPERTAQVEINSGHLPGAYFNVHAELAPDALRELARCLIDAAADIEAEQQGGAA